MQTHDNTMAGGAAQPAAALFRPLTTGKLALSNRVVMAPMTRGYAANGVMGPDNAAYYRRRAEAGVGLVITEGTWIDHAVASDRLAVPRFYGEDALSAWKSVLNEVHQAGGRIFPQLWHVGMIRTRDAVAWNPAMLPAGPSGLGFPDINSPRTEQISPPMSRADIAAVVQSFGQAAEQAYRLGFDGIELHGAHGYLIDQFFWDLTNRRDDEYGGGIRERTRFAVEIIRECRRRTAPDFPICLRYSQWKSADYEANLARNPGELEQLLAPLVSAGVDIFHCSTRRYWEPAFEGSELSLAGWTKKITGKTTIAVGSVGLNQVHQTRRVEAVAGYTAQPASLDRLLEMLEREEFDLVAVGRAMLVDHAWARKVRNGNWSELLPYSTAVREIMY